MPPCRPGVLRACASFGCTTARCGAGTVRFTTSRQGARSCASRIRVLPSGPTAVDMVANAAFYYGLVRAIVDGGDAPSGQVPFAMAERDLHRAARDGLAARLSWRGADYLVDHLIREVLLPAAAAGLDAWGVDPRDRDHYLGVIEARVRRGRTGAAWQTQVVRYLEEQGLGRIRGAA